MAINFFGKEKRQKYLILVFLGLVLITMVIVWRNYLSKPEISEITTTPITLKPTQIEIDFSLLENPIFQELQPFEEIKPFQEKLGRENPFLPY